MLIVGATINVMGEDLVEKHREICSSPLPKLGHEFVTGYGNARLLPIVAETTFMLGPFQVCMNLGPGDSIPILSHRWLCKNLGFTAKLDGDGGELLSPAPDNLVFPLEQCPGQDLLTELRFPVRAKKVQTRMLTPGGHG